jgi:hypothetical protein
MNTSQIDSQLSQIETKLDLLSAALIRNDANELLMLSSELQSAAAAFLRIFQSSDSSLKNNRPVQLHIKKISAILGSVREGLNRYNVSVERALGALMPATQSSTYSPKSGVYSRQPYGSAGRQSGEFMALSA